MSHHLDDSAQRRNKIISRQHRHKQQPASIGIVSTLFEPVQIDSLRRRIGVSLPSSPQVCGSGLASRSGAVSRGALLFPNAAGADWLLGLRGRTVQKQNQLRLGILGKKITLDYRVANSARGRFAQPVFHQHLLDARQAHLLMPSFLQSLLNRFQFPNAFPQNDQQDLPRATPG
jgi:hypothetical protein